MQTAVYGDPSAAVQLIQPVDDHDLALIENEFAAIKANTKTDFGLTTLKVNSWNTDLSPWEAPAVFGNEGFGAGAERTLEEVCGMCTDPDKTYVIGGYSLAGLFALWAVYQTDLFAGAAAASPSVWFPGFTDYMKTHEIRCSLVYLSLGTKEEKTRNPVMSTVGGRIREAYDWLKSQDVGCILEWNAGNHFRDADLRTAKGFAWVMDQAYEVQ